MFVVTVIFEISEGKATDFMQEMTRQAHNSLRKEDGCHMFDVCVDENDEHRVFLYELYSSRSAFDIHMASDHYQSFAARVTPWVADKEVSFWALQVVGE